MAETVAEGRLSSAEAARRLGIRIETLYAYVSRGLLASTRVQGGRGSSFAVRDVDRLARSGTRARARAAEPFRFPSISTSITLVRDGTLSYRGQDAVLLSRRLSFEDVTDLLWGGDSRSGPAALPAATAAAVRRAVRALPRSADPITGLRVALTTAATLDPLRHDLQPGSVRQTARLAVAALLHGLPTAARGTGSATAVADRILGSLSPAAPDPRLAACVQASLVLLADHGLAASTVCARVAASARADPYAVIGAGLGALDSPLHGAASSGARAMLAEVDSGGDPGAAVVGRLRSGRSVPGIGHPLYPRGDPRAQALFALLTAVPSATRWLAAARAVEARLANRGTTYRANVDLALAVLTLAAGMPAEAGEVIFGIARSAGWIAHALEEYREEPLRWRGRELYTGPEPAPPATQDDDRGTGSGSGGQVASAPLPGARAGRLPRAR